MTEEGDDDGGGGGVEGVGKSTRSSPGKQGQRDFRLRFEGSPHTPYRSTVSLPAPFLCA